ncbi:MAG: hypothetical protein H6730_36580 [Deltaproteobacteria bacterium]|nr:hypothetical protein [Deltaproteobacteria bacterium]
MLGVHSLGTFVNDTLGIFGIKGGGIGAAIDALTFNSTGMLANLHDQAIETAYGRGTGPMERQMMSYGYGGMSPMGFVPSPSVMMPTMAPYCGCGYSGFGGGFSRVDLAPGSGNVPFFSSLFDPRRRAAGNFERMLRHNPAARAAFEASVGGRIVDFGLRNDGKMTIQRFGSYGGYGGYMPPMGLNMMNPMASTAFGWMSGIGNAVTGVLGAGVGLLTGNPFMGFLGAGLGNVFGMMGPAGAGFGMFDNSGPMGGRGFGSWNPQAMPGRINNTNPFYENAHQAQIAGVLSDPSLTVEDKVTLMIMMIMNKMDKDIERQSQYINSIQQQQSNKSGGKGGKGGKGGGGFMGVGKGKGGGAAGGGGESPSIDVETMKLKRMVDKRSQMFDMLRQIIDKYNETAKGIIQSIGR